MYKLPSYLCLLLVAGCSHLGAEQAKPLASSPSHLKASVNDNYFNTLELKTDDSQLQDGNSLPRTANINHITQQVSNELVRQFVRVDISQPILVTTPVLANNVNKTNALGLQIQQGLMSALHGHQFNVLEFGLGENLKVTPEGDFILSRDWEALPADVDVRQVVVSTMSLSKLGIALNVRLVDLESKKLLSAAQAYIRGQDLYGYVSASEKVVSKQGLLYRKDSRGQDTIVVLGDEK